MIKRLLFALLMIVSPLLALGDSANRAFLLTNEGVLFTVESAYIDDLGIQAPSTQVLLLTVRDDQNKTAAPIFVPETLLGGAHTNPALAYDSASKTLFILWQRAVSNGMASDLMFCSYSNGQWSDAISVDSARYHYSSNIQIAVTHKVDQVDEKGNHSSVKDLTVHAVWWEERPTVSPQPFARYAMISFGNGDVDIQLNDLSWFTKVSTGVKAAVSAEDYSEALRHPAILESATHDSVDVFFGDLVSNSMHRVTIMPALYLKPASEGGRLRVPIGVKDTEIEAPKFHSDSNARISAIAGDKDKVALYTIGKTGVSYVSYVDGAWSPQRTLAVDDKLSADAAVDVLRRMINAE